LDFGFGILVAGRARSVFIGGFSVMISDKDLLSRQQARQLAQKAKEASRILAGFSQNQIDTVIDAVASAADQEAEILAKMAHEETTYGKTSDKIIKNRFASRDVYRFIQPLRTVGIIGEDSQRKILMVAEPVGVVAAIIPSTNPTSTAIYKVLISLKGRNSIVISPHPSAKKCICHAAEVMTRAAIAAGAPEGTINCMTDVSQEGTQELMQDRNVGVILATGGMGIVRLAYSCGKPAFGVGPGNVPALIERSANIPKAVRDVVTGTTFDNGTLCSSEQSIVCESSIKDQVVEELRKLKAHFLSEQEAIAIAKVVVTPTFGVSPRAVGKPAAYIAQLAGFQVPQDTSVLVAPLKGVGKEYPLSIEKLSPILALYDLPDFSAALETCIKLIRFGGMGHTMSIHSTNDDLIREAAIRVPVFRLIVNSPSTHGSVGLTTGLDPAMTLGCGAVGGNITSDNISPMHLINIKRVAYEIRPAQQVHYSGSFTQSSHDPVQNVTRPFGSLEEKIAGFLDQKGFSRTITTSKPPEPVQTAPAPPAQKKTGPTPVSFGEHKLHPIHPPKTTILANPQVSVNPGTQSNPQIIGPVDFVCEDDVRKALAARKIIAIHKKTIITPAAKDLAFNQNLFKKID
jgi:acetaldehyde dehydrogenase (acetylating)